MMSAPFLSIPELLLIVITLVGLGLIVSNRLRADLAALHVHPVIEAELG